MAACEQGEDPQESKGTATGNRGRREDALVSGKLAGISRNPVPWEAPLLLEVLQSTYSSLLPLPRFAFARFAAAVPRSSWVDRGIDSAIVDRIFLSRDV